MRFGIATMLTLIAVSVYQPAQSDPYRWCADYGGGGAGGGGSNCYFLTIEQCRAAVAGNGGFCRENGFYDGRPVTTPEDGVRASRKQKKS